MIDINLQDPNNLTSPTAIEGLIRSNNAVITAAFMKAVSRDGDSPNYMWADLDLNGFRIVNINTEDSGSEGLVKRKELALAKAGEFRVATNGDLEYREAGDGAFEVLYTIETLRGPQGNAGLNGTGIGDLLAANNLSDVDSATTARENLGLEIGVDVQAYDANLNPVDPDDFAAIDDPRFDRFPVTLVATNSSMALWGRLYRVTSGDRTVTVQEAEDGCVNTLYVAPGATGATLVGGTGISLYLPGNTTPSTSLDVAAGGFCSIVCVATDGTDFLVSGAGLTEA